MKNQLTRFPRSKRPLLSVAGLTLATTLGACTGSIEEGTTPGDPTAGGQPGGPGNPATPGADPTLPGRALAATSRLRRLTVDEYNRTLFDLLGDTASAGQILSAEPRSPFDNDFTTQVVSSTLIAGTELLAGDVSSRLLADKARRDRIVGCTPKGVMDAACLEHFVTTFGRRAWRRTLGKEDVARLMNLQALAQQDNDFYSAVDGVVRAVLQDPEFLFRVEAGTPVPGTPGLFKLAGTELATRLSYFLWGSMPDDNLLTLAEGGGLDTADQVRSVAGDMLARTATKSRIARFHAMWMGYEQAPATPLGRAMKSETDALMARVIFEQKLPWQELLRSPQTYVTYDLAKHYGMTQIPGTLKAGSSTAAWVPYTGTKRQGLLSHGSFLGSTQATDELQLTIRRGKSIRERLFCQVLPPKPANVNAPAATASTPCKPDVLAARTSGGTCQGCHSLLNPVGFGLDNYDDFGAYRADQYWKFTGDVSIAAPVPAGSPTTGATRCQIDGNGDLDGQKFNGPAELAGVLTASPALNTCAVKQLYRFAMGSPKLDDVDQQFIDLLGKRVGTGDFRFDQLLLDFVSSDAFAHRRAGK